MKKFCVILIGISGLAFTIPGPLPQPPQKFEPSHLEIVAPPITLADLTNIAAGITAAPVFDRSFPKFKLPENSKISWAAAASKLPPALWVYKNLSQQFPVAAISNLMILGGFTNELHATTNQLTFVNRSNMCSLILSPSQGFVRFLDSRATASHWNKNTGPHETVKGIPSMAKAETLALKLMKQFRIQRSNLTQKANGHLITFGTEQSRGYFDRRRGKYIDNEVIARGIFFSRRIDGVSFVGIGVGGGCKVIYGNHARLTDFELVWRNLLPYERYHTATPTEITQIIRDGKAVLTHKNVVNPREVTKLTITDVSPLYMSAPGREVQDFVYPFAQVEALAEIGGTNQAIQLYCPILKD